MQITPLIISFKVAIIATLINLIFGTLIASLVSKMKVGKRFFDILLSLPMILPPTVIGFLLLMMLGSNSWLGKLLSNNNISFVFTTNGAILCAVIVSFPLMYRCVRMAMEKLDSTYINAARTLGMKDMKIFLWVILPLISPNLAIGAILVLLRALGEFGATIILAGNVTGQTENIPVAIYTAVQGGNNDLAYKWTLIVIAISLISIVFINIVESYANKKERRR